jgi:hypothetical protein
MGLTGQILLPDWSEGGKGSWEVEMNRIGLGNDCIEYKTSFFTHLSLPALLKDQLPRCRPLTLLNNHPIAHHAFKHSHASMTSSAKRLRSGVTSFFALLNVLSHSVAVAGIARVSNA